LHPFDLPKATRRVLKQVCDAEAWVFTLYQKMSKNGVAVKAKADSCGEQKRNGFSVRTK